ncbi:MAG: hypothetical protein JNK02_03820 [Planctomycetes bacterium]|nr:hypothetical protein [Planctomycetota bacterium]
MVEYEFEIGVVSVAGGPSGAPPAPELAFLPGVMPHPLKQLLAENALASTGPAGEQDARLALQGFLDQLPQVAGVVWDAHFLKIHLIDRLTGQWISSYPAWTFALYRNGGPFEHDVFLDGRRARVAYRISAWAK